ncbi:MAG: hypothetical protein KAH24_00795 [Holophagae bacterium]|nr:hypothetical protein [Holophagae bacterium]
MEPAVCNEISVPQMILFLTTSIRSASFTSFIVLSCLLFFPVLEVQAADFNRVIIRNVKIVDLSEIVDDKIVQILIEDGTLSLVTEDPIAREESDLVIDADKGVLMGGLKPGARPSFMIFAKDPRIDFTVMLDTNRYAVFAIHKGDIFRNNLTVKDEFAPDEKVKEDGWLAYIPPSMAVPENYLDSDRWNRWETRYISGMITAALALDRTHWLTQDAGSEALYGDLNEFSGGEIRALRVGMVGTLNFSNPWIYNVTAATNAFDKGFEEENLDAIVLYDYRIDVPSSANTTISIGKQKEPISMDRLMPMIFEPMQERASASDAMLPARNVGVVWSGRNSDTYITWAAGAFNDWLDTNKDFNETASQFIGRLTWVPLVSEDESNLLHLGVGYRYSDAKEGFRYFTEPEMNKLPVFVDTGIHDAESFDLINLELSWRKGPFWFSSEYMQSNVKNSLLGDPSFDGYHLTASWVITGEMRPYNKKNGIFGNVPVAKTIRQDGIGAWEIGVRYSALDLADEMIDGGDMQISSLGLNWWLTPVFCLNMNYRHIESEQEGLSAVSDGFVTRILLMLE